MQDVNVLGRLDRVQDKFLEDVGITSQDSLLQFNLAPLASRQDIAMLDLVHRALLRKGPEHFLQFLYAEGTGGGRRHPSSQSVRSIRSRSALGLMPVYNMLQAAAVEQRPSVLSRPTFRVC